MKILAFDTSGNTASVAVLDESNILAEFNINHKKNHSLTLMPLIESALSCVALSLNDCTHIALSHGPGSFTGLRMGGATAKALAHGTGLPIVAVPTLDALAYNIFMESEIIAPIMDAKRKEIYGCIYLCENGKLKQLTPYLNEGFTEFLDRAKSLDSHVSFLGDGCFVHGEAIVKHGFSVAPSNNLLQRASSVGLLALKHITKGKTLSYSELELEYLRKPQAQRELEGKLST